MQAASLPIPTQVLADFCVRRGIRRLALFGSVLRDDFGPDSDVDVLVEYDHGARHDLWDHYFMQEELRNLLGRRVDLVSRSAVERSGNWLRRKAILESARIVYVAG
jgi:hypothetical protein